MIDLKTYYFLKKHLYTFVIVLFFYSFPFCQNLNPSFDNLPTQHVFLLGNLENVNLSSPIFSQIKNAIQSVEGETTLIFNGDFIDKNGIGKTPSEIEKRKIENILELVTSADHTIFVPGDREWDDGEDEGLKKVKAFEKYFKKNKKSKIHITPSNGCVGPEIIDIGENLRIVTINTQWWVHRYERPEEEDFDCTSFNEVEFWDELEGAIEDADNRNVIVAAHHPVLSFGQYSGYGLTEDYLLPPFIGSFIAGYHMSVGSKKDLAQAELTHFSKELLKRLERFPPVIYTSGHEYDLQINYKDGSYHINSGAIQTAKRTGKSKYTKFRQSKKGFVHLEFSKTGAVQANIWNIKSNGDFKNTKEKTLYQSPCNNTFTKDKTPFNQQFNPCPNVDFYTATQLATTGNATAGKQFKAGKVKRFFFGDLYRSSWATELKNIPYLNLDTLHGGLNPYAKGGGAQTVSLKFKSEDGQYFVFRLLEKTPTKRMDKELKNTFFAQIMQDVTSHQHPYAPLVVSYFMDVLELPHSKPQLYLMPDHPRLGAFREEFAGRFGYWEIKPKGKKKGRQAFKDADKVVSTFQLYRKLLGDNDHRFDTDTYVMARIFDMWISDWDRHQDNWKWLGYKNEKGMTFTAFPKDRDKAFNLFEGVYRVMDWEMLIPYRSNFGKNYRGIKSMNYKAKNMDRILANEFSYEDWMEKVTVFENLMTDEVIEKALSQLPPEVYELSAPEINRILKIRRTKMRKAIQDYYSLLAENVTIVGTNDREIFEVNRLENADVNVQVYKKSKKGEKKQLLYNRVLKKNETDEINLYGLGKEDEFIIQGEVKSSIKVRVIGGDGKDLIVDKSKVDGGFYRTKIYDFHREDSLQINSEAKIVKQNREMLFQAEGFHEDNRYYVFPFVSYNIDDKWSLGLVMGKTWQKFGKPDFGTRLRLVAQASTNKNYRVNLTTEFREVVKKWDMVLHVVAAQPYDNLRFFYGLGNDTDFDGDLFSDSYYRNRTAILSGELGLRRTFWKKSQLHLAAKYEYQNVEVSSRNKLEFSIYDLEKPNGFGESTLAGLDFDFNLDLRDNNVFPTRGAQFKLQNYAFVNFKEESETGGRVTTEALLYFSNGIKLTRTLGIRTGFSTTYGKTPFYYNSYLGQQSNLRGFRKNRFGGESAFFVNTDLRLHFGTSLTRVAPLRYGIYGLFDMGRVWVDGEDSDTLHYSYGGGIYLIPYDDNFNLNLYFAKPNKGQGLFNFKLGFFVQ